MKTFYQIDLTYQVDLNVVAEYVGAHRAYLDQGYASNLLICSGPKIPKTGGIIIAYGDEASITRFVESDPFIINKIATYEIYAFEAVKYHSALQNIF